MAVSFSSERSGSSGLCVKQCQSRRWSIRAITLISVAVSCLVRMVHMVDPEGQLGLYSSNEFAVELLLRVPQLFVLVGIVLVMLLWRRLLLSRQTLKKMNNKLSQTTKAALYIMAVLFLAGSVSVAIDFGDQGNFIAAWVTWCCAVSFLFVLMVVVFHYTGQVIKTLSEILKSPNTTKVLQKPALVLPSESLYFSSSGLCYCWPSMAFPKLDQGEGPVQRKTYNSHAQATPVGRPRRVSLSRITQSSSVMSRSNIQRVRSAVLWTACLWSAGLALLAPAFVTDSVTILSRESGGLSFATDGHGFVVYFLAFRIAEVLAVAGILRAQWLGAPEDIEIWCFRSYNSDSNLAINKNPLLGILLQLCPWIIWLALWSGRAVLPETKAARQIPTALELPKSRGNTGRPKLTSTLSAQRQALVSAVARSSLTPSSAVAAGHDTRGHDSKEREGNNARSPTAEYMKSVTMAHMTRRSSVVQTGGKRSSAEAGQRGSVLFSKVMP